MQKRKNDAVKKNDKLRMLMEVLCMQNKQNRLTGLKLLMYFFPTCRCQQSALEDMKILSSAESQSKRANLTARILQL